ncbi:ferritin-like domain-containing protein [Acidothermaceae bacterium B102]|nr:ferritin-like domain-containing protein [Acidothermaceae bacterium B102]
MTAPTATPAAIKALQLALAAEHAAIYGYSAAGGHLTLSRRPLAVTEFTAHSTARDQLAGAIRGRGAKVPAALAAYAVPVLKDGIAAATFLATLEDATAAGYAGVLGATDDAALRRFAVGGLIASASRATTWRLAAGATPTTRPFPGIAGTPT